MSTADQIVARKERMALYARAHGLALAPGFNPQVGIFGGAAVRTLKIIQTYLDLPASGKWGPALQAALFPPVPQIRHDYHALRSSGTRLLAAVRLFVLHDMEDTALDQAAEDTGRFFEEPGGAGLGPLRYRRRAYPAVPEPGRDPLGRATRQRAGRAHRADGGSKLDRCAVAYPGAGHPRPRRLAA